MIGPEGAVNLLLGYLQANMPAKVTEISTRLSVTDLRTPALYAASLRERVELAEYPAVEVQFQQTGRPKYMDNGGTQITWQIPYRVRVYVEERGGSYDQVEQRRKRLFLAVMEVVAFDVKLSTTPNVWVDFTSLSGSFFGIGNIAGPKDSRSIAATYLDMDVIVEEMTEPASTLGTVDKVIVSVLPAQR